LPARTDWSRGRVALCVTRTEVRRSRRAVLG